LLQKQGILVLGSQSERLSATRAEFAVGVTVD